MTINIVDFYHRCNAIYSYSKASNPRRVLTRPNLGMHNNGRDNEAHDLILTGGEVLHGNTKKRLALHLKVRFFASSLTENAQDTLR